MSARRSRNPEALRTIKRRFDARVRFAADRVQQGHLALTGVAPEMRPFVAKELADRQRRGRRSRP